MAAFAELDQVVDGLCWHTLMTGGRIDAGVARGLRSQMRMQLLDELAQLAVQRAVGAISEPADQLPKRPGRKVRPISEPPH